MGKNRYRYKVYMDQGGDTFSRHKTKKNAIKSRKKLSKKYPRGWFLIKKT